MKNLKKLRLNAGLSQQALAARFSLSQQTIYKYENALAEPDISTLKGFADYFGVSVDYLVGQTPTCVEETTEYSADFTSDEIQLIHKIRKLRPDVRAALDVFIDSLSNTNDKP